MSNEEAGKDTRFWLPRATRMRNDPTCWLT